MLLELLQSEQINELASALAKAQGKMPIAKKATQAHHNKYAMLEELYRLAQPVLEEYGLSVVFRVCRIDGDYMLLGQLTHESGQWIRSTMPFSPTKEGPQGIGAANTYAKRQLFSNLVGIIAEGEDDDGDAAQEQYNKMPDKQKKPLNPNKCISEKQQEWLKGILNNNEERIQRFVNHLGYSSIEQITMGRFDEALELAERAKKVAQNKSNAEKQSQIQ